MSTAVAGPSSRGPLDVDAALASVLRAERRRSAWAAVLVPVVAIISALIIGGVLIAIEGTNPLSAYGEVVHSVLRGSNGLSYTFVAATPLVILASASPSRTAPVRSRSGPRASTSSGRRPASAGPPRRGCATSRAC